jgi:nicotinamidase-related amidase
MDDGDNAVTALLVIDMQKGLFTDETPRYDADGVVERINALGRAVRGSGGLVVFIQHDGPQGDALEMGTDGWQLLPSLERGPDDVIVCKSACDAFYSTDLAVVLDSRKVTRLIVTGCATDFCVDTTVRAAISREYQVVVAADGHTTADRPHIDAAVLIQHQNWLWRNLIHPKVGVEVVPAGDLILRCQKDGAGGRKGA